MVSTKRTVNYCLQALKDTRVESIILIICIYPLQSCVVQRPTISRFLGGYNFLSAPWAADCIILSKENIGDINVGTPLSSLFAPGMIFNHDLLVNYFIDGRLENFQQTLNCNFFGA